MGHQEKPVYSGLDKYPGWLATVITLIIGGIFLGALSTNFHHDGEHSEGGHAEEGSHAEEGGHGEGGHGEEAHE
jgi:hypothetical protein